MLQIIAIFVSLFLIFLIYLRIPQNEVGLETSKILNSPTSSQRFLNNLTITCISMYFGIALILNGLKN
jgi:preprotein translocase subunit SecG